MTKPRYQHDCIACHFLGRFEDSDLYVCSRSKTLASLIARQSSDGPDYSSMPVMLIKETVIRTSDFKVIDYLLPLLVAYRWAIRDGHIKGDES